MQADNVVAVRLTNEGDGDTGCEIIFADGSSVGESMTVMYDADYTEQKYENGKRVGDVQSYENGKVMD